MLAPSERLAPSLKPRPSAEKVRTSSRQDIDIHSVSRGSRPNGLLMI